MKNDTLMIEKLCYEHFINSKSNLENMKIYAKILGISLENFLTYSYYYIEKNVNKPDYVKLLDTLSILKNNDEVIKFFETVNVNHIYLKNNLLSYFENYRPHIYYLHKNKVIYLRDKIIEYENYLYRKLDPVRVTRKIDDDYAINMVNSFVNSKYSLNRFCFNNKISIINFKSLVQKTKYIEPRLYNQYLETIFLKENQKRELIKEDVLELKSKIKENNNNFSLIDFCLSTDFDVLELVRESDKLLSIEDAKLFRRVLKPFREIDILTDERLTRLFRTKFTLNINDELVNITDEDKYTIINYLHVNDIPVCNESFKDGCIKLYNYRKENLKRSK